MLPQKGVDKQPSSQKGVEKVQLNIVYRAIILHFIIRGRIKNPTQFKLGCLLSENPDLKSTTVCYYDKNSKLRAYLNEIYSKYGENTFDDDNFDWLNTDGSLTSLSLIPESLLNKYNFDKEIFRTRIRNPNKKRFIGKSFKII